MEVDDARYVVTKSRPLDTITLIKITIDRLSSILTRQITASKMPEMATMKLAKDPMSTRNSLEVNPRKSLKKKMVT